MTKLQARIEALMHIIAAAPVTFEDLAERMGFYDVDGMTKVQQRNVEKVAKEMELVLGSLAREVEWLKHASEK